MDFESLMAQLLQQRALQTKVESDAKHGAIVAQLRATSEAEGYRQLDAQRAAQRNIDAGKVAISEAERRLGFGEGDYVEGADKRIHGKAPYVTHLHQYDGMPVYEKADAYNREVQKNDIAATMETGRAVPDHLYSGLTRDDILAARSMGIEMRGLGGEPVMKRMHPGFKDPTTQLPLDTSTDFRHGVEVSEDPALAKRFKAAGIVDEYVRQNGYDAGLFDGMTQEEAARRISDQLMAQRARQGDLGAWAVSGF